jgi:hypothetical protein
MKKDNKSDYTINFTRKALNFLAKNTSLDESEAVKLAVAELKASDGYKRNLCITYNQSGIPLSPNDVKGITGFVFILIAIFVLLKAGDKTKE